MLALIRPALSALSIQLSTLAKRCLKDIPRTASMHSRSSSNPTGFAPTALHTRNHFALVPFPKGLPKAVKWMWMF